MQIIKDHLEYLKVEQPREYNKLIESYGSEEELLKNVLGLTNMAMNHYNQTNVVRD